MSGEDLAAAVKTPLLGSQDGPQVARVEESLPGSGLRVLRKDRSGPKTIYGYLRGDPLKRDTGLVPLDFYLPKGRMIPSQPVG